MVSQQYQHAPQRPPPLLLPHAGSHLTGQSVAVGPLATPETDPVGLLVLLVFPCMFALRAVNVFP
jgi:hypothetical protein